MSESGIVSLYVTCADAEEAARIGRTLIEERLAACINIMPPCRSLYRWNGRIEEADEVPAVLKTSAAMAELAVRRITELHSYENPAVCVWPVDVAPMAYVQWVKGAMR